MNIYCISTTLLALAAASGSEGFWESLGQWYNAVFFIPYGVVVLFMLLQLVGAGLNTAIEIALGDAGFDADVDVDADMDVDMDMDMDVDADVDVDMDFDAGVDADADVDMDVDVDGGVDADADADMGDAAGHGIFVDLLVWFGAGRIPFSYIAEFYFIVLGTVGLLLNPILFEEFSRELPEGLIFLVSFTCSFGAAVVLTKLLSIFWIKYLPTNDYTRISSSGFSGREGEVISAKVDIRGGRAYIHDSEGHLQQVFVRTAREKEEIMKGEEVVLGRYLPRLKSYIVERKEVKRNSSNTVKEGEG